MQPRDTERLTFRPGALADAELLDALNRAPGVMEFLDREPPSLEHLRTVELPEQMRVSSDHPGYGMWLARLKPSGEFVGRFTLQPNSPGIGDAEIGYRLLPAFWGSGLATEGASELLRYGLADLHANRIVATTMAVNVRSRQVMERIGLTHVRTFHVKFDDPLPGTEQGEVEYAMTVADWSAN